MSYDPNEARNKSGQWTSGGTHQKTGDKTSDSTLAYPTHAGYNKKFTPPTSPFNKGLFHGTHGLVSQSTNRHYQAGYARGQASRKT